MRIEQAAGLFDAPGSLRPALRVKACRGLLDKHTAHLLNRDMNHILRADMKRLATSMAGTPASANMVTARDSIYGSQPLSSIPKTRSSDANNWMMSGSVGLSGKKLV